MLILSPAHRSTHNRLLTLDLHSALRHRPNCTGWMRSLSKQSATQLWWLCTATTKELISDSYNVHQCVQYKSLCGINALLKYAQRQALRSGDSWINVINTKVLNCYSVRGVNIYIFNYFYFIVYIVIVIYIRDISFYDRVSILYNTVFICINNYHANNHGVV